MNNTLKRILTASVMVLVFIVAAYFGLIRWLALAIALGMIAEVIKCKIHTGKKVELLSTILFLLYSVLLLASVFFVSLNPSIMLMLFLIIAAADTGAWFFGRMIGGDKMWERLSPKKTWAGQIAGIICGMLAAIGYGFYATGVFFPDMIWLGIGIALLSQYGDMAASSIKRNFGIKDFSNILPGHGGLADRFDGWIFVLPIFWFATL